MDKKKIYNPLALPPRWLNCPRKANNLIDKFLAFKVPLSAKFDKNVPLENRFHMSMLIDSAKRSFNMKVGLIIDLTNTSRFYDSEAEVKQQGIKYFKINCKGHGETPSVENANLFINVAEAFIRQNPLDLIGVHCTHGFNRTGFLICCYLVEKLDYSIDMAVNLFADVRPPGIYKQEYLNELFNRYGDSSMTVPIAPPLPTWEEQGDDQQQDDDGEEEANSQDDPERKKRFKRAKMEDSKLNAKFADPDLLGIETCTDPDEISRVRFETQSACNWNGAGFPGAQPVSMDQKNIRMLYEKKYMVSWKADGTRYLMYINGRDKVYMLDRDNSVFRIRTLTFPHRKMLNENLTSTLVDGEFVIDEDPTTKQKIPRFLIYDIIKFEENEVAKMNFEIRLHCISKEIIFARDEATKKGLINKQIEPFSVRQKQFFPISGTKKLISKEFEKQLSHGIDGLIFQPVDEPYKGGRCDSILKWKPPSMNSVDFKLIIVTKEEIGMLPEKIGQLYVTGYELPFSTMKVTKAISGMNNRIIECRWNDNRWEFMRERLDKSYPNHYNTAIAVCESIKFPITEEKLTEVVQNIENMRQQYQYQQMAGTSRTNSLPPAPLFDQPTK